MIGLLTDDNDTLYQQQLDGFVDYCDANYLELNVSKIKGMVIDFRTSSSTSIPIVLKGSNVERVSLYKYLGIVIDDKLSWYVYIDSLIKRRNTIMYCLRRSNFFNVDVKILALFYDSVVESVWRYCLVCWGGNVSKGDRERVERIVKEAGKIIGVSRQDFGSVYTDLLIKNLHHVVDYVSHPLHDRLSGQLIARSGRMRLPSATTSRYLSSFVPQAIRHHNASHNRGDVQFEM